MVSEALVVPEVYFGSSDKGVPSLRHWKALAPFAFTEKLALPPGQAAWLPGCALITRGQPVSSTKPLVLLRWLMPKAVMVPGVAPTVCVSTSTSTSEKVPPPDHV